MHASIGTRIGSYCLRLAKRLHREESGATMLFIGLGFFTLVAATGVAVDMSRLQSVRAKLSNALDAAGLAAGAKTHSSDMNAVVDNYMNVNYPDGYLDSHLTNVKVSANEDNTLITVSATAVVDMTFMRVFGKDTMEVYSESQITRENRGLELVMALDVTGSMYGTKISDLRAAATDMVDILFGKEETVEHLWVGMVPYSTTVNIGPDKTSWLRNYDPNLYPPEYPAGATKWKGCVEARGQWPETNGYDLTDDVPYTGDKATASTAQLQTDFPMYFWEDSDYDNDWITTQTTGSGKKKKTITVVSLNQDAGYSDTGAKGPNVGCGNEVTPFTNLKSVAQGAVDELTPWRRGGTMSSIGMAWAWRMISPKWRGMWDSAHPELPLDYGTPKMSKAVIIMTDGVNEVFTPYSSPPYGSDYTGYRRVGEERMGAGVDTKSEGIAAVNAKFSALCTSMKAQGIIIYAVTFQLGHSTAQENARTMFRDCATHPDYYFDSPDGATLRKAFRTIGDSLANLMISK